VNPRHRDYSPGRHDPEAGEIAAFKAGVNIIVYSLTSDYKKDVIHHPFIKRRQNL